MNGQLPRLTAAGSYGWMLTMAIGLAFTIAAGAQAPVDPQGEKKESTEVEAAQVETPPPDVSSGGSEPAPTTEQPAQLSADAMISEAQKHFRQGAELYRRNLYREALSEFNRALALEPSMEDAKKFRDMSEAKLNQASAGKAHDAAPSFEIIDPSTLIPAGDDGSTQLSAEELKIQRVRELNDLAAKYLEAQMYKRAVDTYNEVLLIAPDNRTAQQGLHSATIAYTEQKIDETGQQRIEDANKVREKTAAASLLPEGADGTGLKPYRFTVPSVELEKVEEKRKTKIEDALDSPVGITFEGQHISAILEFVSEYFSINLVLDSRVVKPPTPTSPTTGAPGAPGAVPGQFPAAGGAFPGAVPGQFPQVASQAPRQRSRGVSGRRGRDEDDGGAFAGLAAQGIAGQQGRGGGGAGVQDEFVTDGMVPYIKLEDVTLKEGLKALLRPLNLDFSVQPGFVWISTPDRIRYESFEELETRIYELRNAGAESLFKLIIRNNSGGGGGGFGGGQGGGFGGGQGGGQGGFGGGQGGFGGGQGGFGGGQGGFGGGQGGGGQGGFGGGQGGFGGGQGGFGGGQGGFGGGQGGFGGGGQGGFGGGGQGGFGGGGQGGFGGGGGGGGAQFSNISQLFSTISDQMVGEPPAVIGLTRTETGFGATAAGGGGARGGRQGLGGGGQTGFASGAGGGGLGGGEAGFNNGANVGSGAATLSIITILTNIIDDVIEPYSGETLSYMDYNPMTNQLIVHNSPKNLDKLEKQLTQLDVTPKQVRIESKFVTVSTESGKSRGFSYDIKTSNKDPFQTFLEAIGSSGTDTTDTGTDTGGGLGGGTGTGTGTTAGTTAAGNLPTYSYDINGDGINESIPMNYRPNGSRLYGSSLLNSVFDFGISGEGGGKLGATFSNDQGDKLGVTLDYLEKSDNFEFLSAPSVVTMNRKPAVVGDFITRTFVSNRATNTFLVPSSTGLGSSTTLASTESVFPQTYVFGITLSVTPQISGTDQVRMWLNPQVTPEPTPEEFDQFTTTSQIGENTSSATLLFPRTRTQSTWTNVIVRSGDTLVLGGTMTDTSGRIEKKIPYLGDIPVLKFFFSSKTKTIKQKSLLIFVTADIIDPTGARSLETEDIQLPY